MSDTTLSPKAIEALRARITQVFPGQIRSCLERLTDDEIWWRPNEASNSIGNIVIHVTGSLEHFLNRGIGGFDYVRDRPAEFAERQHIPRSDLLARFESMLERAGRTFDALTPERLVDPSPEQKLYSIVFEDLLNAAIHLADHTGQIVWITKMIKGGWEGELWMTTHRNLGGWKPLP